jgi:hypothetical protein
MVMMSKTNDTTRELTEAELDAVSGGYVYDSTYVVGIVAAQTKATKAFGSNYTMFLPDGTP